MEVRSIRKLEILVEKYRPKRIIVNADDFDFLKNYMVLQKREVDGTVVLICSSKYGETEITRALHALSGVLDCAGDEPRKSETDG